MHTSYLRLPLASALFSLVFCGCVVADGDADDGDDVQAATESADDGPVSCVSGQTVACVCAGGAMGAQTCDADGEGFGACACGDQNDGPGDDGPGDDGPGDDGPGDDGPGDDGPGNDGPGDGETGAVEVPTYDQVVFIMQQSCGSTLSECHGREAFGASLEEECRGWAAFEDAAIGAQFYAGDNEGQSTGCPDMDLMTRLLDLNSWQCGAGSPGEGLPLVVPGDPDASYILMKIDGDVCMIAGEPSLVMPPPDSEMVISAEDRATIEAWIVAGAPGA